jgi:hypothetical protein
MIQVRGRPFERETRHWAVANGRFDRETARKPGFFL